MNKVKDEFKVGKHNIGWVNNRFLDLFGEKKLKKRPFPTAQTLPINMTDAEIEAELKLGLCEPSDILAFLDEAPEIYKNGYANLFYTSSCVVGVGGGSDNRKWRVLTWKRGDDRWLASNQVFSPATDTSGSQDLTLGNSDTLELRVKKLEEWATNLGLK